MTTMHDMMHDNTFATRDSAPDHVADANRSAWEIIEEVCAQRLTGELHLTTTAPTGTRVYMNNGLVYFAEHDGDDSLASRLVISGAVDDAQIHRGAIRLNGTEHLGRLFERDATIERDAVELAIELITEMVLTDVADLPVRSFRATMYRHHPSGINRWFSSHQTIEDEPVDVIAAIAAVQPVAGRAAAAQVVEAKPVPAAEPEPEPELVPVPEPEPEPDAHGEIEVEVEVEEQLEVEPEEAHVEVETEAHVALEVDVDPTVDLARRAAHVAETVRPPVVDLSDIVAAMGVSPGRAPDLDADRPVVSGRMWAPALTPREPPAPPPSIPEPFDRTADAELDALIASLVKTPVRREPLNPQPAAPIAAAPTTAATGTDTTGTDTGVREPQNIPDTAEDVAARVAQMFEMTVEVPAPTESVDVSDDDVSDDDASDDDTPLDEPLDEVERVTPPFIPVLPTFTRPAASQPNRSVDDQPTTERSVLANATPTFRMDPSGPRLPGTLFPQVDDPVHNARVATSLASIEVPWIESEAHASGPAADSGSAIGRLSAMTPATSSSPLASVHPIRETFATSPPTAFEPTAAPIHLIPELGDLPVPEDVAAAVRRAISAIEAATLNTGPLPVTFGPLHVTAPGLNNAFAPITPLAPVAATTTQQDPLAQTHRSEIQTVHDVNGHVTPLLSLGRSADLQPLQSTTSPISVTPTTPVTGPVGATTGVPRSAAEMPFPEIVFPDLPPVEELLSNPLAAPISTERRGALRRLIDGIRRR